MTEPSVRSADLPLLLRLTHKEEIAKGIFQFEFRAPEGGELPPFTAGAHLSIRVPSGLLRKYSLCGDVAERDRYVIAVKCEQEGRGGSNSLINDSKVGDTFDIGMPVNDFELPRNAQQFIFIAGGIGITPMMAFIKQLAATPEKRFKLFYLTRSPETTAFREVLSAPEFKGKVVIHHDNGDPSQALDLWPVLEERKNREHVYCCGPRPLMDAVRDMSGHWSPAAIHFEAFADAQKPRPDDVPCTIKLAKSGETIEVPVGTTILEAMRAHGHEVPSSCESGTCGTCRTRLIEGEADHRDLCLPESERGSSIMICVSRAKSPILVLDR